MFSSAVSKVGKAVRSVANSVLEWNTSTSSGAVDIIVVRRKTKSGYNYYSTPFHVKFGIFQLMKSSDCTVSIEINDEPVSLKMKLSRNGFAYFSSEEDWDAEPVNLNQSLEEEEVRYFQPQGECTNRGRFSRVRFRSVDTSSLPFNRGSHLNYGKKDRIRQRARSTMGFKVLKEKSQVQEKAIYRERKKMESREFNDHFGLGKIKLSLCANKLVEIDGEGEEKILEMNKVFKQHRLRFEGFEKNPLVVYDTELVVKWKGKIYPGRVFMPYLTGMVVFEKSFDIDTFTKNLETFDQNLQTLSSSENNIQEESPTSGQLKRGSFESKIFTASKERKTSKKIMAKIESKKDFETNLKSSLKQEKSKISLGPNKTFITEVISEKKEMSISLIAKDEEDSVNLRDFNGNSSKSGIKPFDQHGKSLSLTPTSEQLAELPLRMGINIARFSVASSLQGTQIVEAGIYLWDQDAKVVITDIDGTITKSDVLGFILPNFGNNWAHRDVAKLFRLVSCNGYRVLYLTARLFSLTSITRQYLFGLDQTGGEQLPEGPILTVPLGLMSAYRMDQFRRPHDMKIQILRDVLKLFGGKNPFYAGFGNKDTDRMSYKEVGVPNARIFIINPTGDIIKHQLRQSYSSISEAIHQIFPPIDVTHLRYDVDFGMNYWKPPTRKLTDFHLEK